MRPQGHPPEPWREAARRQAEGSRTERWPRVRVRVRVRVGVRVRVRVRVGVGVRVRVRVQEGIERRR